VDVVVCCYLVFVSCNVLNIGCANPSLCHPFVGYVC
jgi:hypothetical protein